MSLALSYEFERLYTSSKSILKLWQESFFDHSFDLNVTCREAQEPGRAADATRVDLGQPGHPGSL